MIKEIMKEDSIYQQVMDNILYPNLDLKPALISEITLYMLENKEKVDKVINEGYFKYWFIRTVTNQVKSSTSPFHKNVRETISSSLSTEDTQKLFDSIIEEENIDIEDKLENEKLYGKIEKARNKINCTWFESEMFRLYYDKGYTYRQIEKEFNIDHVLAFHSVTKLRKELKRLLKDTK